VLAPRALVIDVPSQRVDAVVAFWAGALDATPRWPDRDAGDPFVPLDGARSSLQVLVQQAVGVPRYHVDLPAEDLDAAANALVRLGASKVRWAGDHWVLRDPAGLLLCLIPEGVHAATTGDRAPGRVFLDGLFIDVPGTRPVEDELAFWSSALGASVEPTTRPESYTSLQGVRGPGGDLLVEVQRLRDGAPRFHVDLSTDDVQSEADRLETLGATRVAEIESWVTLADPAGNLLCVVPS
jgi:catechol 2,3-dioxygenase-like lactoylglutathione lyase family enzyme